MNRQVCREQERQESRVKFRGNNTREKTYPSGRPENDQRTGVFECTAIRRISGNGRNHAPGKEGKNRPEQNITSRYISVAPDSHLKGEAHET
jgi:hypothetical protein